MNNDKTIEVLNSLIEVHNERVKGYEIVSNEVDEIAVKTLLSQFILFSQQCLYSLGKEVRSLGGIPTLETSMASKLYGVWMDAKYLITCNDGYTALNSCQLGEGIAVEMYKKILTDNIDDMTLTQQKLVQQQFVIMKAAYDQLNMIKDRAT